MSLHIDNLSVPPPPGTQAT